MKGDSFEFFFKSCYHKIKLVTTVKMFFAEIVLIMSHSCCYSDKLEKSLYTILI